MQTEFPARDIGDPEAAAAIAALAASSMHDCVIGTSGAGAPELSADDRILVDLRYEPLMARVIFEELMTRT